MIARIAPAPLSGAVDAIPSKSCAHRALICAALADRPTEVAMTATSGDIEATADCLRALGAGVERSAGGLMVAPIGRAAENAALNARDSGSTLRFLLPVASALGAGATFSGEGRLPDRPGGALIKQLRAHGAIVGGERLPLTVSGRLRGGLYELPGDVSSQFATGLLFALPLLPEDSEIRFTTPVESRSYLNLTVAALHGFSVEVLPTATGYRVPGRQIYRSPGRLVVEGDWSAAAFFLAAGALNNGSVAVAGLDERSAQGDRAIVAILADMRARDERTIDASDCPDLVPIVAAAAALTPGTTRIERAARLRLKESDRLAAMAEGLTNLGGDVRETPDGLLISGGRLRGGRVRSHGDHRIAMALAIAAAYADGPVEIDGAEAVAKSYPGFFEDFNKLGGAAHVQSPG
ncbi:MAG: 3-phosphoshikimate 1-carboxyvinyltransferase [Clostridiales bacterium]|nr:3-phosphoshikimate 1-carboxyvinyltransferase [Clostridiales bacterium]